MKTNIMPKTNTPQQYRDQDISQKVTNNVIRYCELTPKTLRLNVAKLCLMDDSYVYTVKKIPYAELLYGISEKEINHYIFNDNLFGDILFSVTIKLTAFIREKVKTRLRKQLIFCINRCGKKTPNKAIVMLLFIDYNRNLYNLRHTSDLIIK